jgi:hypothetical protein
VPGSLLGNQLNSPMVIIKKEMSIHILREVIH